MQGNYPYLYVQDDKPYICWISSLTLHKLTTFSPQTLRT